MNLDFLKIGGNPLASFPQEIMDAGTEEILKYLSSVQLGHLSKLRTKLTVIGDTKAGKTCLIQSLVKKWLRFVPRGQHLLEDEDDGPEDRTCDRDTYDEELHVDIKGSSNAIGRDAGSGKNSKSGGEALVEDNIQSANAHKENNDENESEGDGLDSAALLARNVVDCRINIQRFQFEKLRDNLNAPRRITPSLKVIF